MNGLSTRLAIRQATHRSAVREIDERTQQRGMNKLEHAVNRMRASGHLPFCPDGPNGRAPRTLREAEMAPELAGAASRIDAVVAAFALGVMLGMLI